MTRPVTKWSDHTLTQTLATYERLQWRMGCNPSPVYREIIRELRAECERRGMVSCP
jgi:hypothetical protein